MFRIKVGFLSDKSPFGFVSEPVLSGSLSTGAPTGYAEQPQSASTGNLRVVGANRADVQQPLEMQGAGASQHRPASISISEDDGTRTRNHRIDSPVL